MQCSRADLKFLSDTFASSSFRAKKGVLVIVNGKVLHAILGKGKMFVVGAETRYAVQVAGVDRNGDGAETFAVHHILLHFYFNGFKVTGVQIPIRLEFSGAVHR